MLFAFGLALVAVASGWLLSYLYLAQTSPVLRFCAGACTGLTLLGFVGFLFASLLGMTTPTLVLTATVTALPLLLLLGDDWRRTIKADARQLLSRSHTSVGAVGVALGASLIFSFAIYERDGGIFTGFDNNLGDLPFHVGIITGFAKGENFPPQHTEYAGVRLTYPFLIDFIAALFVRAGATLQGALLLENVLLIFAFIGTLYAFARELTGEKTAARLSILLVLLSGGLGWWVFFADVAARGLFATLAALPRNYTITFTGGYRWGNALTVLLIPQRSLLLGTPLFLLVCTLLWQSLRGEAEMQGEDARELPDRRANATIAKRSRKQKKNASRRTRELASNDKTNAAYDTFSQAHTANLFASQLSIPALALRRIFAAGIITGMLPLIHAHTFAVLLAVAATLAVLFHGSITWRAWAMFFAAALLLAAPQIIWVTRDSPVKASDFIAWEFGWDRGAENPVWFWLKNTGVFLPLLIAALVWRRSGAGKGEGASFLSRRVKLFYVPFACIFIGANLLRLSPWVWDNIKLFFLWFVASAPLVALLLVHLWRTGKTALRLVVVALVVLLTAAGALDILRVAEGAAEQRIFSREDVQFAALLERTAAPAARILHAPVYNHPVFLTGRRSLMGYPGHLWTHGISYQEREREIQAVYANTPGAADALRRYGINYIVVSPHERGSLKINEKALSNHKLVAEIGAYRLYRVAAN